MGSIKHFTQKIKGAKAAPSRPELLTALIIVLVAFASFGLGRLSVGDEVSGGPVQIIYPGESPAGTRLPAISSDAQKAPAETPSISGQSGLLVASKNSDKYHYPWCSGAARISEANKIWFQSKEEAERAGYKPASNCPGL